MIGDGIVLTGPTRIVLEALVAEPARHHHGAEVVADSGLPIGAVYPVLARLESLQWVESGWEEPAQRVQGWPRRRFYRLSSDGLALARGALASARAASAAPQRARPIGDIA